MSTIHIYDTNLQLSLSIGYGTRTYNIESEVLMSFVQKRTINLMIGFANWMIIVLIIVHTEKLK